MSVLYCTVLYCTVLFITVTPRRQCPREFEQVGADCFHLSDRGAGWIEAKKRCEAAGGGLVTLDTASRAAALLDWVGTRTRRRRGKYWTSGNDIATEGAWRWAGGGAVPAEAVLEQSLEENCLSWSLSFGFSIGDSEASLGPASCCNNLRYICQV